MQLPFSRVILELGLQVEVNTLLKGGAGLTPLTRVLLAIDIDIIVFVALLLYDLLPYLGLVVCEEVGIELKSFCTGALIV